MAKSMDKPLPSSPEAETAILGGILIDNRIISQVVGRLEPDDFYSLFHRRVFGAMLLLAASDKQIDPILIAEVMKRDGPIDSFGGITSITNLSHGLPYCSNVDEYVQLVADKKRSRDALRICSEVESKILGNTDSDAAEIAEMLAKAADSFLNNGKSQPACMGLSLGNLLEKPMPEREEIIRGLARGENGLMNGTTNSGKTSNARNIALAKAIGREFSPLVAAGRPGRVAYFDFEDTEIYTRSDFSTMFVSLTPAEIELARSNIRMYCDVAIGDDPLQLSNPSHFMQIVDDLSEFKPDLIIIDTAARAFVITDENNNTEVKEKVMKPLKRLAVLADAAVLALHHIGKAKSEDGATREAAHRGRGASSFADQSRAIYNLEKDPINDTVTISCAKIKGPRFDDHVLRLDSNTRWFSKAGEIRIRSNYELVMDLFEGDRSLTTAEVIEGCRGKSSERAVKDNLKMAKELGDLVRLRQGVYQKPSTSLITDESESAESARGI